MTYSCRDFPTPHEPNVMLSTAPFWLCLCGHPIYDHTRVAVPSGGGAVEYVCGDDRCRCLRFRASDGSGWPHGPAGVRAA